MIRTNGTVELGISLALAVALTAGCSDGGGTSEDAGDTVEMTDDDEDSGGSEEPRWRTEFVETGGWGRSVDLEVSEEGSVALAYFSNMGRREGQCEDFGDSPPPRTIYPLHFALRQEDGWSIETVDEPVYVGSPRGIDLEWSPDGAPTIAALVGEPLEDFGYCGSNDAGLYRRNSADSWTPETAVSSSGAAAVDKPGADFGEVVGVWPSLAYDAEGNAALVYKDAHAGGRQADDFKIASLEVALREGDGWTAKSVDPYRGAGDRSRVAFDDQGRPVVVYVIRRASESEDQLGVWAARSGDGGDNWQLVQLFNGGTSSRPSVAVDPETGAVHVLFYNARRGFPELAVLEEPSEFGNASNGWRFREEGIGNPRFDAGYNSSLAFGPEGKLHAAFYRCTVASGGLGDCNRREDAVIHAWREDESWEREVVDTNEDALCGMNPALGFDGSGHPVLAYKCNRKTEADGGESLQGAVKFAIEK